jgi:hypothetical protein
MRVAWPVCLSKPQAKGGRIPIPPHEAQSPVAINAFVHHRGIESTLLGRLYLERPNEAVYQTRGSAGDGIQYGPSRRCEGHPLHAMQPRQTAHY